LTGTFYLASRTSIAGLGDIVTRCAFVLGAALCALELAPFTWIAAPLLFVVGMSLLVQIAATNTIVQTVVDTDKLGRVMSLYSVAVFGGAPVGALLQGALASGIGPIHTLFVAGCLTIASALA